MRHTCAFVLLLLSASACSSGKVILDPGEVDTADSDSGDTGDTVVQGSIAVSPATLDFGLVFVGQASEKTLTVSNVGDGDVDVSLAVVGGGAASYTLSPASTAPAPGALSEHLLHFAPGAWGDLGTEVVVTEAIGGDEIRIPVSATVQIDEDGDGHGDMATGGDDCDDGEVTTYPGAPETWYDGVDSDCAGDDDFDQDGDGVQVDTDCDDTDASTYPGAPDDFYDGVDSDCGGENDYDLDGDGHESADYGGDDCDDRDPDINPDADETWYDGVDQDCDGASDFDQDGDGYTSDDYGGTDCDDRNDDVFPGAPDTWYDGVDSDCAEDNDYDQDGDGLEVDEDCDDTDATVTGPTDETLNWKDDDCDGVTDNLDVADARSGVLYGATTNLGLGDNGTLGILGDITGDGAPDIVAASDGSGYGYAWVVDGDTASGVAGLITSYDTAQIAGASGYYLVNWVVGPAADEDGDGTADLMLGGWYSYYGYYNYGSTWLFSGGSSLSGSLDTDDRDASFTGDSSDDLLRLSALGDVDGDGYADVITGAPYDNYGSSSDTGNIGVFLGGGLSGAYDLDDVDDQIHGQSSSDLLGYSLVLADVDDDGYVDMLAGAPSDDDAGSGAGAVYIFAGNGSASWSDQADAAASVKITGASSGDNFGLDPLPHPGDVDGDGHLDVLVGLENEGDAWLFLDGPALAASTRASSADHNFSGTAGDYATALAFDSDLDGDGADDIAIGADSSDVSASDSGAVYIYRYSSAWGSTLGTADADAKIWGTDASDYLGTGLAGGADLDGDGLEDLLVGAVGVDDGVSGGGAVYIIRGW